MLFGIWIIGCIAFFSFLLWAEKEGKYKNDLESVVLSMLWPLIITIFIFWELFDYINS